MRTTNKGKVCTVLYAVLLFHLPTIIYGQASCLTAVSFSVGSAGAGNLNGAPAVGTPTTYCGGGTATTTWGQWFTFTATSANPTITVTGGNSVSTSTTYVQVLTGTCGTLSQYGSACQSIATPLYVQGLTIGTPYYVRVYSVGASAPTSNQSSKLAITVTLNDPPSNDDPSGANTLTPGSTCVTTTNSLYYATPTTGLPTGCDASGTSYFDVWYKFVATSPSQSVTITTGSGVTSPAIQLYSYNSGTLTSLNCGTTTIAQTGLTTGNTYYVRVSNKTSELTGTGTGANINICVQDLTPANDDPSGASTLNSGSTCSATSTNMNYVTPTTGLTPGCEAAGTYYDVWYKVTASATTEVFTLSSLGASMTSPAMQLYSGTPGALTSLACTTGSNFSVSGLTSGTTYYLRVSNYNSNPGSSGATFSICAYGLASDECSGAISLTAGTTCSAKTGTLNGATPSTGLPAGCESTGTHYDIWYSFSAGANIELINLTGLGTAITSPEVQVYKGSCGSLVSIACASGASAVSSFKVTNLTKGVTYYVRVSNVGTQPTTNGGFSICVYHPYASIDYSRSYVNLSKGTTGGTVNPGDTLEMRLIFVLANNNADSLSFVDTLYKGRGLQYVPNSLAVRTNEDVLYKSMTDATADDAGWIQSIGTNPDTLIHMNFGTNASSSARGALTPSSRPSVFQSTCILMLTYKVLVTAPYNTLINFRTGSLTYRDPAMSATTVNTVTFPADNLIVYQSPGLCPNATSATNAVAGEYGGTFGAPSGSPTLPQNRGTSSYTTYNYMPFSTSGGPQDYFYGVANNTSQNFTTVTTWTKPDNSTPVHRVFQEWDITGDHTNATNTALGNPPCDTSKPVSTSNPCGYMLVINSAYKADTAFTYSVTNLCPNTYYEIAAWFKNMCYKCACDSLGNGSTSASFVPSIPGDSAGVRPNIAFDVNGVDYFTTGDIKYSGTTQTGSDATNQWVKRGFTYLTGTAQTSFTLTLRNNAPGGGGNDWALDDIGVNTCMPNMQYSPTVNPTVCQSNTITVNDTVRSYFNTYQYYKWQTSTNSGSTWSDISGASGTSTPIWNGSAYQFITSYTIPTSATTSSNNGNLYRVMVATSNANLTSANCQVTDGVSQITLSVQNCGSPLDVQLISFNGKLVNHYGTLQWSTANENAPVKFEIERSLDQSHFTYIQTVIGKHQSNTVNYYTLTDSVQVRGKVWYRIAMIDQKGNRTYTSVITLEDQLANFDVTNVINPFDNTLQFQVNVNENARLDLSLLTLNGTPLRKMSIRANSGVNSYSIPGLNTLAKGVYLLQVNYKDASVIRKIIKN